MKNNSSGSYQSSNQEIAKFNTIVGISALAISNTNNINIFLDIGESNNINIRSDYILEYFRISFVSVYSQYCHYKTPYYESTNDVCYSICP